MKPKKSPRPREIAPEHQELIKNFGEIIKCLRIEKKRGLIEMANEIRLSRNEYSLIEQGKLYFKFSTLLLILDYHHISFTEFTKKLTVD